MTCRDIAGSDIPALIVMLLNLRDESPTYCTVVPNMEHVQRSLERMIGTGFAGVIDMDQQGVMLGALSQQWYDPEWNAYEQLLYVSPRSRGSRVAIKLIRGFERRAAQLGAVNCYAGTSTGINEGRTRMLYLRLGYEPIGAGLRKRLQ